MFAAMEDAYFQARAADVKDVSGRIIAALTGVVQGGIDSPVPVILAADDLAPSETVQLDKSKILGFVTEGGSGSSHIRRWIHSCNPSGRRRDSQSARCHPRCGR